MERAFSLYEKNVLLSARFLVCTHFMEIALRNEIHVILSASVGHDWMLRSGALLYPQTEQLKRALEYLGKADKPAKGNFLVSELPLGFWVGILSSKYEKGKNRQYWRRFLHKGFAHRGDRRDRPELHGRYDELRNFRNRVAHHERILHQRPERQIDKCLEAIGWISPEMRNWARQLLDKMP